MPKQNNKSQILKERSFMMTYAILDKGIDVVIKRIPPIKKPVRFRDVRDVLSF